MAIQTIKQLEAGMYQEAARKGTTFTGYLQELARTGDVSGDLVKLGSEAPRSSKGEPLDAFKQVLAKAGIRTKGELANTGDAFFSDPSNRILFPEFVTREYREAERDLPAIFARLEDFVTNRQGISGSAYRSGVIERQQEQDLEFGRVSEGAELPVYTVVLAERAVNVHKYGGILMWTYEAVRQASLPMLSRYLGVIARAQVMRKVRQAISVALNGDGNSNPAPNTTAGSAWTIADLISLQVDGALQGAIFDTIVADSTEITGLLNLFLFTDMTAGRQQTPAGQSFLDTGALPAPLGMRLRLALPGTALVDSKKIMGIDSRDGLVEAYENGSEITESDRLIHTQFERIALSENIAYTKPSTPAFRTRTRP